MANGNKLIDQKAIDTIIDSILKAVEIKLNKKSSEGRGKDGKDGRDGENAPQINDDEALSTNPWSRLKTKEEIAKVEGKIYPCTAQALEDMTQEQQAELYVQGYRAIKTENNGTVVLLGLASDGSLEWLGCDQPRGNLLDNSNFAIAQAGYGGAHGTQKYAADRWLIYNEPGATLSVSWVGNGIKLSSTGGGSTISQRFPANSLKSLGDLTCVFYTDSGPIFREIGQHVDVVDYVDFLVESGHEVTVYGAALYTGLYTAKTLPPWEAPDSVSEMTKCRQFYRSLSVYGFVGIAIVDADNSVQGVIFGEQMRIFNPSILGDFVVYMPTLSTNITAFNSVSYQGNGFRFSAQTTGGMAIGTIGFLVPSPNSGAILADI